MGNHLAVEQHPIFTSFIRHTQDPPGVNPKGDPHEGFPEGRKEREPPVSKEVIDAWRVPSIRQNFCVEDYIKFRKCQIREHPMAWNCHRELHHLHHCEQNEKILRMKEFERERRLRLRAYKKDQAEALAAAREAREAMDDDE